MVQELSFNDAVKLRTAMELLEEVRFPVEVRANALAAKRHLRTIWDHVDASPSLLKTARRLVQDLDLIGAQLDGEHEERPRPVLRDYNR